MHLELVGNHLNSGQVALARITHHWTPLAAREQITFRSRHVPGLRAGLPCALSGGKPPSGSQLQKREFQSRGRPPVSKRRREYLYASPFSRIFKHASYFIHEHLCHTELVILEE